MVIIFHIQHTQIYHFHSFFFGVKKGVKVACGMKNVLTLKKNTENSQSSLFLQQKI